MNEEQRRALHLVYKEKLKKICLSCFFDVFEHLEEDSSAEEVETLINEWVDQRVANPNPEWKPEE